MKTSAYRLILNLLPLAFLLSCSPSRHYMALPMDGREAYLSAVSLKFAVDHWRQELAARNPAASLVAVCDHMDHLQDNLVGKDDVALSGDCVSGILPAVRLENHRAIRRRADCRDGEYYLDFNLLEIQGPRASALFRLIPNRKESCMEGVEAFRGMKLEFELTDGHWELNPKPVFFLP